MVLCLVTKRTPCLTHCFLFTLFRLYTHLFPCTMDFKNTWSNAGKTSSQACKIWKDSEYFRLALDEQQAGCGDGVIKNPFYKSEFLGGTLCKADNVIETHKYEFLSSIALKKQMKDIYLLWSWLITYK